VRVLIAPDKFKGSLTAAAAAEALAVGVRRADPHAEVDLAPMADGGEGTVEALVKATGGRFLDAEVTGPLGEPVVARFGLLGDGTTAAIEMAAASGLVLVPADRRDPACATTFGTGELLLRALDAGARAVILGIGGSATNDGGAGLAQALGFRLLDADGRELARGGGPLADLARIDPGGADPRLARCVIRVASDVDNPLCGPRGASAIYGPQKGAGPDQVATLDRNLGRLADVILRDLGAAIADLPGAGASGGLGAGLVAFAGARLEPGIDLVCRAVDLDDRLAVADLCLTGEGALDRSSAFGKTVVGVARRARERGVPTIVVAGTIGEGAAAVMDEGVTAYLSMVDGPLPLDRAIAEAPRLLAEAAEQVVRIFRAGRGRT